MSMRGLGHRLYSGEVSFDIIGRRRTWYVVSAVILLISIGALGLRGLNLGIEFRGGSDFAVPNATCSVEDARTAAETQTGQQAIVTETGSGTMRVQTEALSPAATTEVTKALGTACGVSAEDVKVQVVGPTWGSEISKKALQGLGIFLLLVALFLSLYFEWRMALAALVALAHDILITIGIYALTGLEVTPATVIGLLTILGYSLYDTVVVFDKIKENTKGITGQSMRTYSDAANLAVNQTLVRSINTTVVALLPVMAIIVIGAGFLGASTLLDLAVALAIGMATGAYSSIFIAPPFLCQLKEAQPEMKSLAARVRARRGQAGRDASEVSATGAGDTGAIASGTGNSTGTRQQPRRGSRSKRGKR